MKIGILTFHHVLNYGAVLQCFGLKKSIEKLGYDCEVIPYKCEQLIQNEKLIKFNKKILIGFIKYLSQGYGNNLKKKKFNIFIKKYFNLANEVRFDDYTDIIVGSDQVWNLKLTGKDYTYFLENIPSSINKLTYAASFGESAFIESERDKMLKLIKRFKHVSMREDNSSKYLLTQGIKSKTVCDPVYLLSSDEWKQFVVNKTITTPKKYVIIYCVEKSKAVFNTAKKLAKEHGAEVLYLNSNVFFTENGIKYVRGASPEEFLQYIYYADYVVTNSFHGTSFSLIFNKKVIIDYIWHNKKNNRIDNLLKNFDISNVSLNDYEAIGEKMFLNLNYNIINKKMSELSNDSKKYLRSILGGENNDSIK